MERHPFTGMPPKPHERRRTLFVEGFRPRTPRQSLDAADEDDLDGINGSVDSDTLGWSVATDVETAAEGPEQLNKKIEDSHIRFVCFVGTFAAWVGIALCFLKLLAPLNLKPLHPHPVSTHARTDYTVISTFTTKKESLEAPLYLPANC
jgi:hypothetical protein